MRLSAWDGGRGEGPSGLPGWAAAGGRRMGAEALVQPLLPRRRPLTRPTDRGRMGRRRRRGRRGWWGPA